MSNSQVRPESRQRRWRVLRSASAGACLAAVLVVGTPGCAFEVDRPAAAVEPLPPATAAPPVPRIAAGAKTASGAPVNERSDSRRSEFQRTRARLASDAEQREAQDPGDDQGAAALWQELLALEVGEFGEQTLELAETQQRLAECYERLEKWDAALKLRHDRLELLLLWRGPEHYTVGDERRAIRYHGELRKLNATDRLHLRQADAKRRRIQPLWENGGQVEAEKMAMEVLKEREGLLGENHLNVASSLHDLADLQRSGGRYWAAEPLYRRALTIREKTLGDMHPDTALSTYRLGDCHRHRADLATANDLVQRSLTARENTLGKVHLSTAESVLMLAYISVAQNNYPPALPLLQRVLDIREQVLGADHPDLVQTCNEMAILLSLLGDRVGAAASYRRSLEIRERQLGPDHPDTVQSLSDLAGMMTGTGQEAEAETLYLRALSIQERVFGPESLQTAAMLDRLANHYQATFSMPAEATLQRALSIREQIMGPDHIETAASRYRLASLYISQQKNAQAAPLLVQTLATREQVFGHSHLETAAVVTQLVEVYRRLGNTVAAEPLAQRALRWDEQHMGPENPLLTVSLQRLADIYSRRADFQAAETLLRRALENVEKAAGPNSVLVAGQLDALARLHQRSAAFAAADAVDRRLIEIYEKEEGPDSPVVARCLGQLAEVNRQWGKYSQAESLLLRSLQIRETKLGADNPDTAASLDQLASLKVELADYVAAKRLLVRALAICRATLEQHHPYTARVLHDLGVLHRELGDDEGAARYFRQALVSREIALGPDHQETADSRYAVALLDHQLARVQGQPSGEAVESLIRRAVDDSERSFGTLHPRTADFLHDLAMQLAARSDLTATRSLLERILAIRETALGVGHPATAATLHELANLDLQSGNLAAAEPLFKRALAIREQVFGAVHPQVAATLQQLAELMLRSGNAQAAENFATRAWSITVRQLEQTQAVQTEAQQLAMRRRFKPSFDLLLSSLSQQSDRETAAFEAVNEWKGAALVHQRERRQMSGRPEFAGAAELLGQVTQVIENQAAADAVASACNDATKLPLEFWQRTIKKEHLEQLELELGQAAVERRQVPGVGPTVDLAPLAECLPDSSVLVTYVVYDQRLPAITPEGKPLIEQRLLAFTMSNGDRQGAGPQTPIVRQYALGPLAPVTDAINVWRESFGGSVSAQAAGRQLRETLWQPMWADVHGKSLVLISLDGPLELLPFAGLPGQEAGSYLLEDHRLAMVPSPRLIPQLIQGVAPERAFLQLLLLGKPDPDQKLTYAPPAEFLPEVGDDGQPSKPDRQSTDDRETRVAEFSAELSLIREQCYRRFGRKIETLVELCGPHATETSFRVFSRHARLLHVMAGSTGWPQSAARGSEPLPRPWVQPAAQAGVVLAGVNQLKPLGSVSPVAFVSDDQATVQNRQPQADQSQVAEGEPIAGDTAIPDETTSSIRAPVEEQSTDDDGYLTLREISTLPLAAVELMVLSGNQSALGDPEPGEAPLSLQRAFLEAGVSTIIASVGSPPADVTARLMERFYGNLWAEQPLRPLDALREAQLWLMRKSGNEKPTVGDAEADEASSPALHWAAFSLSGDWR